MDPASLSVGADGVVRYTLVVRSPQGAQTVTFEGIRCATREVRGYATGRADGSWSQRESPWRAIPSRNVQRWHAALADEYFCVGGIPLRNAQEGVQALRRGDHPRRGSAEAG